jgi:HlyD family secretion protein
MQKRVQTIIIVIAVLAMVGIAARFILLEKRIPDGLIVANGRMEGRSTLLFPKMPGWVGKIVADEGYFVNRGDILAVLYDRQTEEQLEAARQAMNTAMAQLAAAEQNVRVTEDEVVRQIATAQAGAVAAGATVLRVAANHEQAKRDADRYTELAKKHFVAETAAEQQRLNATVSEKAIVEAKSTQVQAQKQLELAQLGWERIKVLKAQRDAAAMQVEQARAQVAQLQSVIDDYTIKSPLNGVVLTRGIEAGERVNNNSTLYTLVDLNQLYLKAYVPEPLIGKVALGQQAQIWVDAFPDHPFAARVRKV